MKLKYRPDIDGLRAISILLVITFHAFPKVLHGGFIGVDVFFVISGYLITTIILKNIDNNQFSFVDFYAKRIKRLYPSLLVVLIATLGYGWLVLFPAEFKQLGKHALASAIYINNIVLYKESGYFDLDSSNKPLLHLWSLGIEEQFYLIWPFLLFALNRKKMPVGWLLTAGLATSFLLNIYYIYRKHSYAFYMPTTRFWELFIGAGLAYVNLYKKTYIDSWMNQLINKTRMTSKFIYNLTSWIGLSMIIFCAVIIDESYLFPGWWALMPTVGAFLIIFSGQESWTNKYILSNKIMVGIGTISYPLYLWHWPLLSFPRIINKGDFSLKLTVSALILCVILAYLTYALFETPVRKKRNSVAIPLIVGMVPIAMVSFGVKKDYVSSFISYNPEVSKIITAIGDWDYPAGLIQKKFNNRNIYSIGNYPRKTLFFGDSNIEQYAPRVKKLINENKTTNRSAVFITSGGAVPIPNVYEDKHPDMISFVKDAMDYVRQNSDIDTIVIGAQWLGYLSSGTTYFYNKGNIKGTIENGSIASQTAQHDLLEMLKTWTAQGKKVFLVTNMPIGNKCCPESMIKRDFKGKIEAISTKMSTGEWQKASTLVTSELKKIAKAANATAIDPSLSLCDKDQCHVISSTGNPFYKDSGHLRPSYVENHATFIDQTLDMH